MACQEPWLIDNCVLVTIQMSYVACVVTCEFCCVSAGSMRKLRTARMGSVSRTSAMPALNTLVGRTSL